MEHRAGWGEGNSGAAGSCGSGDASEMRTWQTRGNMSCAWKRWSGRLPA